MKRWIAVVTVGAGLSMILSTLPAQAMAPKKTHVDDSFKFTNHFCSFPIRVTTRITGSDSLFFDGKGNVLREELHLFVYGVWKNRDSGKQAIERDHVHNVIYPD